jgi:hypothetical protein
MTLLLLLIPNEPNRIIQNSSFEPMVSMLSMLSECEWRVTANLASSDGKLIILLPTEAGPC